MSYPKALDKYTEEELYAAYQAKAEKRRAIDDKKRNRVFTTGCKPVGWYIVWGGNELYGECELVVVFDKNVPRRETDYYDTNKVVALCAREEKSLMKFMERHPDFFKGVSRVR
jgi:hypothetical protein